MLDRRVFVDRAAEIFYGECKAADVTRRIQRSTSFVEQSTEINLRTELIAKSDAIEQLNPVLKNGFQNLCGFLKRLEMRSFARNLNVAGARKCAVDSFACYEAFDEVDRAERCIEHRSCRLRAIATQQLFGRKL